jgi:hypothetical protein
VNPPKGSKSSGGAQVGSFLGSPLYVKLFESLKSALGVYKTSLEARSAERLVQFVSAVLQAFATVLEYSAGPDLGKQVEEYLTYIRQGPATKYTSPFSSFGTRSKAHNFVFFVRWNNCCESLRSLCL